VSNPSFQPPRDLAAGSGASKPAKLPGCGMGCLVLIGVVIVLPLIAVIFSAQGGDEPYNPDNSFEARSQCEDLVRESLKAPSTADFGELNASRTGGEWIVTGTVDAENSFGAMLRSDFQCTVKVEDGRVLRRLDSLG
jgi:hypothetical protein